MAPKGTKAGSASGSRQPGRPVKAGDDLSKTRAYQDVLKRLKATFEECLAKDTDDPQSMMMNLRAERDAAKQLVKDKNAEIGNCMKKVARLASKGKKLSDDGLLLEFRRRQLFKAKAKATLEKKLALELERQEEK